MDGGETITFVTKHVAMLQLHAKSLQLCLTFCDPMDCSSQAPLSMGILQAGYWSELPCPPSGALPDPGIEPASLTSPALTGRFFTTSATWEAQNLLEIICKTHFCSEIFGSYEKSKSKMRMSFKNIKQSQFQ